MSPSPCPCCGSTEHVEDQTIGPELYMHFCHRCAHCDKMFLAGPERPDRRAGPTRPGPGDLSSVRLRTADGKEYSGAYALWLFVLEHTIGHEEQQVVPLSIHRGKSLWIGEVDV